MMYRGILWKERKKTGIFKNKFASKISITVISSERGQVFLTAAPKSRERRENITIMFPKNNDICYAIEKNYLHSHMAESYQQAGESHPLPWPSKGRAVPSILLLPLFTPHQE